MKTVVLLDLEGKLTIGEGDVQLRRQIERLLESGEKQLILNMERVHYMDSSGVGELMQAFTTVQASGGMLKLLNLSTKIKDILQLTQLLSLFEYFTDEDQAIASFG
jgi:anti-sigma B factor antagonist